MKWLEIVKDKDSFIVGTDSFDALEIHGIPEGSFYFFLNKSNRSLVKRFVLCEKPKVDYICQVVLIKKGSKFTPRLSFLVRDKLNDKILNAEVPVNLNTKTLKANVNLNDCHDNFWKLISFLQSLRDIDIPTEKFSLMSHNEAEIVEALKGRDSKSVINIIKQLSSSERVSLSQADINQLLHRKEKLLEFSNAFNVNGDDENWWQGFFENNKWIFGYGLNYQILRQQQAQPHYGGTQLDGRGGQRGDYLVSTVGDINFTVLVEIKTPKTPLLYGNREIRNGAWSYSRDLTDALSQIEANVHTWDKRGSEQPNNRDRLEIENIYTVQPKGILVIGALAQLVERSKRETFQRFRKSIHGIDILTFDELYMRAKFIVDNSDY